MIMLISKTIIIKIKTILKNKSKSFPTQYDCYPLYDKEYSSDD